MTTHIGPLLGRGVRFVAGFVDMMLKDVTPEIFARMPEGLTINSPAFNIGHLSIYPDKALEMIGRPELAAPDERYVELFEAGKPCVDDADGAAYPPMAEIVARYKERYTALAGALDETPDDVFARENPWERMRDRFPTVGDAASFVSVSHAMMHFGQISAWRRTMGLGSVM